MKAEFMRQRTSWTTFVVDSHRVLTINFPKSAIPTWAWLYVNLTRWKRPTHFALTLTSKTMRRHTINKINDIDIVYGVSTENSIESNLITDRKWWTHSHFSLLSFLSSFVCTCVQTSFTGGAFIVNGSRSLKMTRRSIQCQQQSGRTGQSRYSSETSSCARLNAWVEIKKK